MTQIEHKTEGEYPGIQSLKSHDPACPDPSDETLSIGSWEVRYSSIERALPTETIRQAEAILPVWQKVWNGLYPSEDTLARNAFDTPSLLTRIDGVVDEQGNLQIYEIEPRPAGIGLAIKLNPVFRHNLDRISETWGIARNFRVVLSPRRFSSGTDDVVWRGAENIIDLETAIHDTTPVILRADPDEPDFCQLSERSLAPFELKGDKRYGLAMGMWSIVNNVGDIPSGKPSVLKPLKDSKANGVLIIDSEETFLKAEKALAANPNGMYIQDYIAPSPSGNLIRPYMIQRFFLGYSANTLEWKYLGGFYNMSPHKIVDGGADTKYGPLSAIAIE